MNAAAAAAPGLLYLSIAAAMRRRILGGQLAAGDPLPGETDLADQYGVSRYTVRAALDLLETERMITRRSGKRTTVAEGVVPPDVVVVQPGVQVSARMPLPGEDAGQVPGEPLLVVVFPGEPPIFYPAHRTVIVAGS